VRVAHPQTASDQKTDLILEKPPRGGLSFCPIHFANIRFDAASEESRFDVRYFTKVQSGADYDGGSETASWMEAVMANPHGPGTTGIGTTSTTGTLPIPPMDPEQVREIQLLAEASLVAFTATPNPVAPFGRSTLAWDITMPKTVIPGVNVQVHLSGEGFGDQVVDPKGSRPVAPYSGAPYAVSLRTPLASRQLGTLDLVVDTGSCQSQPGLFGSFSGIITGQANSVATATGGQVKLRGNGSSIDIGYNSFVVDIPLTVVVPNWTDPDIDVSLGFDVFSQDGVVHVTHNLAETDVSFGVATGVATGGCSAFVASALEQQADGFFYGFIGPVLAKQLEDGIKDDIYGENGWLSRLNNSNPRPAVPYKFYDLTLTAADGLTYRFCPAHPAAPPSTRPPLGGGSDRSISRRSTNCR
jgi:hypothetical protein